MQDLPGMTVALAGEAGDDSGTCGDIRRMHWNDMGVAQVDNMQTWGAYQCIELPNSLAQLGWAASVPFETAKTNWC